MTTRVPLSPLTTPSSESEQASGCAELPHVRITSDFGMEISCFFPGGEDSGYPGQAVQGSYSRLQISIITTWFRNEKVGIESSDIQFQIFDPFPGLEFVQHYMTHTKKERWFYPHQMSSLPMSN